MVEVWIVKPFKYNLKVYELEPVKHYTLCLVIMLWNYILR